MNIDSPDQRGTKRHLEDVEVTEPSKPKRIKVRGDVITHRGIVTGDHCHAY